MTAKDLKVLYHTRQEKSITDVKKNAYEIGRDSGISIEFRHSNRPDVFDRLENPQTYDIIILHMECNDVDGCVFGMADKVKERYGGPLAAESFRYPLGVDDVLKHFHNYCGPITVKENFVSLLKDVGYLHEDFKLPGEVLMKHL